MKLKFYFIFWKFNEILLKIFMKIKQLAILAFSVALMALYDTGHF